MQSGDWITEQLTRLCAPWRVGVLGEVGSEKRHVKDAPKQWTGLAEGKDEPFTKEVIGLERGCPGRSLRSDRPVRLRSASFTTQLVSAPFLFTEPNFQR